ncbi:MAG TPA: cyclic nucleotide-binding domain-containing protein, partial [Brevefilum fermentans]|nr:cyclic nucleotide-binding domain-containing protein [Brevefilum fermentans]
MSIRKDTIVEVIAQVPLFAQLNPREMGFLADAFVPMVFQDGDVIFNIGDVSEAMFVVCEGQVVLSYDQADDEFLMAKLSRGDIFGEEALLYDDLRDYRAVASGATIVL